MQHFKNYYMPYGFLLFYGLIAIAITQFEEPFDFVHHTMSQLGKPSRNPDFWWLYMFGGVVSGLILFPFYRSMWILKTDDPNLNRVLSLMINLGYFSAFALIATATVHADFRIPHKICGGAYFFSNGIVVLLATYLIWKHPRVHTAAISLAISSLIFNGAFLWSGGKMAWAEWLTVLLSFVLACYFSFLSLRDQATERAWQVAK